MTFERPFLMLAAALSCGLASANMHDSTAPLAWRLSPEQAVLNAAAVAPQGVTGIFELSVRAAGRDGTTLYLNSQLDYRDQRNLSIEVRPMIAADLAQRFGQAPDIHLLGQTIVVKGTARRVRIDFRDQDGPTGLYYYQTQLRLERADDLSVQGAALAY